MLINGRENRRLGESYIALIKHLNSKQMPWRFTSVLPNGDMNYRVHTINEMPYWVFWAGRARFLRHVAIQTQLPDAMINMRRSLYLCLYEQTQGEWSHSRVKTKVHMDHSTPACPYWSSIQSKGWSIGPSNFLNTREVSANNQRERSKTFMVKRNASRLNKESGPEMVMNTIGSLPASPFD